MKFQELIVLLPCHSLEDFPTHHTGEEAQSLLSSWSALWHPALLASADKAPIWKRVEDPPLELDGRLITVPSLSASRLPTGYVQRAKEEGALVIRKTASRKEILELALAELDDAPEIDPELAADFLALGYAFLQVQLLTRQTRYSSNLDEPFFNGQLLAAAKSAAAGDFIAAKEKLSVCFNLLGEERDYYFPVDAFLLDITLVAETTLGATLRDELQAVLRGNVFLGPEVLTALAEREPASLALLRDRLETGNVGLIGGGDENRWPLLSLESITRDLQSSLRLYETHLQRRPTIFGRQKFGLTPWLPSLLIRLGFQGACHFGLEEGTIPTGTRFAVRWESPDDCAIDAIARPPLDASLPETFLQLASKLGEVLDAESVAALCFAHWPGQASEWLGDLRRIATYCRALGQFDTVESFLSISAAQGQLEKFDADQYRSPYLKQAIIRRQEDPVTTNQKYWQQVATLDATQAMQVLAEVVRGKSDPNSKPLTPPAETTTAEEIAEGEQNLKNAAEQLAGALTGGSVVPAEQAAGFLILNPFAHVRRQGIELPHLQGLPAAEKPIYATGIHDGRAHVVADVPGCGFVWVPRQGKTTATKDQPLVSDNVLRNEFFEAVINPITGALSAIREYNARGNRISQQVAYRMPGRSTPKPGDVYQDPDEIATYSVMGADEIMTTIATPAMGEIVVRGRLMDLNGNRLAGFTSTYRIFRGSRILGINVQLDVAEEPKADPWNSYYCCRFAWGEDDPEIVRTVHQMGVPTNLKRFESPHYVELLGEKQRTTILTGGLPFQRRHQERMLDTLLVTRNERQRNFRLGIGVDLPHPLHDAQSILSPPIVVPCDKSPASGNSGWLFHFDARNVIVTSWEVLRQAGPKDATSANEANSAESSVPQGPIVGVRLRLLETEGRASKLKLAAFRTIRSARIVDLDGSPRNDLPIEADAARLEVEPYEWRQVELRW